jgi:hypothetical protein
MTPRTFTLLLTLLTLNATLSAAPVGTAFTFQGRLTDGGNPANGVYDLQFSLWDALSGGAQVGVTICSDNVTVSNGLFTVSLDFGAQFSGDARWLQVGARAGGAAGNCASGAYTVLSPRQSLTATPYALGLRLPLVETTAATGDIVSLTVTSNNADCAQFNITNPANPGEAVEGRTAGGGDAIQGINTGTGRAGYFQINNTANSSPALFCSTTGTGPALWADGNVGIGTASPQAKLHVTGDVLAAGFLRSLSPNQDSEVFLGWGVDENGDDVARIRIGGNGIGASNGLDIQKVGNVSILRIQNSGRVGIGNPVPLAKLDVIGSGTQPAVQGVGYYGVWGTANDASGYGGVFAGAGFLGGGRSLLVWGESHLSKTGIGTTSPQAQLHVRGNADTLALEGTDHSYLEWYPDGYAAGRKAWMGFGNAADNDLTIRNQIAGADIDLVTTGGGAVRVPVLEITGADLAEKFPATGAPDTIKPGMVMEIDPDNAGKLRVARGAYNCRVAGVVSGAGDIPAGAILGNMPGQEDAPAIALSGRVWVYCDTSEHAIEPGDMLTTSATLGHAMKAVDHALAQGAILGKAMTALSKGEKGLVLVLVSLQ